MSRVSVRSGQRLVLGGVSWGTYQRVLRAFDDRHLRITYDRGDLEIMTLSPEHERFKKLLDRLVAALVEELGWNMACFGSMTFKRRKGQRGLEPDECYWIQSEPLVRSKDKIDLRRDPRPDLVIEIDVTHSSLDRLPIYASFRVPEVWRFDGQDLRALHLDPEGAYVESEWSQTFPFLKIAELVRFLEMRRTRGETDIIRQFRTWVRKRIASGWK